MAGLGGEDRFVFEGGRDVIVDYDAADEVIDLRAVADDFLDVIAAVSESAGNLTLTFGAHRLILLDTGILELEPDNVLV